MEEGQEINVSPDTLRTTEASLPKVSLTERVALSLKERFGKLKKEEFDRLQGIRFEEELQDNPPFFETFSPKEEIKKIRKKPREEQRSALDGFKDKLARQEIAWAACRTFVARRIMYDPDTPRVRLFFKKIFSKREIILFLLIALIGLLFSLTLLKGRTDPDFFIFYYIGRRIAGGADMFADIIENKGPVLYYFFSFLYKLFGHHYRLALMISNWLLDTVAVFLIFKLLETWVGFKLLIKKLSHWFLLFFAIALYKSFSIGMFMGGTYSETFAMVPLLLSILLFERKRDFLAGTVFSLSVLTRQTTAFYLIFFFIGYFLIKRDIKRSFFFMLGFLFFTTFILLSCLNSNNFNYFLNSTIFFNLAYVTKMKTGYLGNLLQVSLFETRIILTIVFSLFFSLSLFRARKESRKQKLLLFSLLVSAFAATFVGGVFYYHHFIQFSVFSFASLFFFLKVEKRAIVTKVTLCLMSIFVFVNFLSFSNTKNASFSKSFLDSYLSGPGGKEYLMMLTYAPEYYIYYQTNSPDRYFNILYLSDNLSAKASFERAAHANLSLEKLKKTLFLVVKSNRFDEEISKEYLDNFGSIFKLEMIDSTKSGDQVTEVYVSKI